MTIALPISRVVVMEDRAQVERVGSFELDGRMRVELGPIAVVAVDRSLEVEVDGATLLDARLVRRRRERPAGGLFVDASALRREVQAAQRALAERADAWARARILVDALAHARADVVRGIAEGAGAGRADPATWTQQLDELDTRQRAAVEAARLAAAEHARADRHLAEARAALAGSEPPEPELECLLVLTLEGQGTAQVRARHQVPCAAWRPAYRARLADATVAMQADAVIWQRTGEDWTDVALSLSTARPTLGTTPPTLVEDRLSTRAKQAIEKQVTEVAVREVAIASNTEGAGAEELPGVDDGGETRLLEVPGKVAIPSDGMPHRVRLFEFTAPATSTCVCAPELAPEACVVAEFANLAGRPLLAGPVDLARVAGSVGRSSLSFTAPGETVELSFGSEDGVSVLRDVEVERDTSRLTGKLTQRTTVTLHVSNASAVARTLQIDERVLVSEVKEVEVEAKERECSPRPKAVDRDGIARIELELAPNATTTATFVWEFRAAGKVAGL
ncbi:MAG: mucoidy inhibitor MuiA family protein [Myxococcales bacterium]|nr:mucoidy inhibitor MuiA family protein [Myxococcales bacterium]